MELVSAELIGRSVVLSYRGGGSRSVTVVDVQPRGLWVRGVGEAFDDYVSYTILTDVTPFDGESFVVLP